MAVEYARVERCGRVALGEYCLHLHLVGDCPSCAMRGNVVEGGVNKGITLHGTHHAHIEEDDTPTALARMGPHLGHVQVSENHRGRLGAGQVPLPRVFDTLAELDYDGWVVVEAFSREDPAFGNGLRIWRSLAPSSMLVAREGLALVRAELVRTGLHS